MVAVDDLTLELATGEFFALLGPSGCGKTTTLRMVGGFEKPRAGRSSSVVRTSRGRRPYAATSTRSSSPTRSSRTSASSTTSRSDFVERVSTRSEITGSWRSTWRTLGLGGFGPRPATTTLGRTTAARRARPRAGQPTAGALLDEPMGALDAKIRKTMQVELKRIQREVGITFLYVTHDQDEAMALGDRIGGDARWALRGPGRPATRLRRTGDAVRRGIPGRLQLTAGDARRRTTPPTRRCRGRPRPGSWSIARTDRPGRRPSREDAARNARRADGHRPGPRHELDRGNGDDDDLPRCDLRVRSRRHRGADTCTSSPRTSRRRPIRPG